MDDGVGHQLSQGQFRVHWHFLAKGLADFLVGRQKGLQGVDQSFEAQGIALVAGELTQSFQLTVALVVNQAHSLAPQGGEILEALGEQNGAQITDMPLPAVAALDHSVGRQRRDNRLTPLGQWLVGQVEVGRVVKQLEHLVNSKILSGQLLLEGHAIKHAPECPLLFREFAQLLLVGANADIFDAIELHRGMAGRLNFQYHHRLAISDELEKAEMNLRRSFLQEPAFQLLLLVAGGGGLEGRADHGMAGILDAPDQVTILLAEQGRCIGQRRDIFANHRRIVVVLFELHPLGFLWQRAQFPEQGLQIAKVALHRHQTISRSLISPGSTTPDTLILLVTALLIRVALLVVCCSRKLTALDVAQAIVSNGPDKRNQFAVDRVLHCRCSVSNRMLSRLT
ncbi:hypothetical protein D9M68_574120 [compost metagenome]